MPNRFLKQAVHRKWLIAALAFLLSLSFTGCPERKEFRCEPPTSVSNQVPDSKITISVYVDGTPSMEGYVQQTDSSYIETLNDLDSILNSGIRPKEVKYYRLGNANPREIKGNNPLVKIKRPDFYSGNSGEFPLLNVAKLQTGIKTAQPDQMTILITDLYQSEADISQVTKPILNSYLSPNQAGYAVGILAVRSEFNGLVYDVGRDGQDFSYDSGNEAQHPFYMLFLGQYQDIRYYFSELDRRLQQNVKAERQLLIFTPNHLVNPISSLPKFDSLPELPPDLKRIGMANNGKVTVDVDDTSPIDLIEVQHNANQSLDVSYTVPFAPEPFTLSFDASDVQISNNAQAYDSILKAFKPIQPAFIELTKWQAAKGELSFTTKFDVKNLEPNIYLMAIDAFPQRLKQAGWIKRWDAPDASRDGARTNNLGRLLDDLKRRTEEMIQVQKSPIGRFCYIVQHNS